MTTIETTVDIQVEPGDPIRAGASTVFLFRPLTQAGREWIEENVVGETSWFGNALVVEHRYAFELSAGMAEDGLVVR